MIRIALLTVPLAAGLLPTDTLLAQRRPVHHRYQGHWPPGTIGNYQLRGDASRRGYFQPVEIQAPEGAMLAMASGGQFEPAQPAPRKVGLQLGSVYRFQVTRIPLREGAEVFPSIELIDRLHPPEGAKWRFPVVVQLTREDLDLALEGRYVMRVIYVENPATALPVRQDPRLQRYFEVRPDADPVHVADQLGRPIAILRIGSRVPPAAGPGEEFLFGSPPWERFVPAAAGASRAPDAPRPPALDANQMQSAPPLTIPPPTPDVD